MNFLKSFAAGVFGDGGGAANVDGFAPSPLIGDLEKEKFMRDGFLLLPNAVDTVLCRRALRAVNYSLGQELQGIDPVEALPEDHFARKIPKKNSAAREIMASDELRRLYYGKDGGSVALNVAQALLGTPTERVYAGQVALRPPGYNCISGEHLDGYRRSNAVKKLFIKQTFMKNLHEQQRQLMPGSTGLDSEIDERFLVWKGWSEGWHVDGWDKENVEKQYVDTFSLLVGVCLTDVDEEYSGNLTVYKGGHLLVPQAIAKLGGAREVLKLDKPFQRIKELVQPNLSEAFQVQARRGDLIIAHYDMPHTIAPNLSCDIRTVIYFRVRGIKQLSERQAVPRQLASILTDPWHDFVALQRYKNITSAPATNVVLASSSRPTQSSVGVLDDAGRARLNADIARLRDASLGQDLSDDALGDILMQFEGKIENAAMFLLQQQKETNAYS